MNPDCSQSGELKGGQREGDGEEGSRIKEGKSEH